jgi:hypothetical protein
MEQQETFYYIYALSRCMKVARNELWSGANKIFFRDNNDFKIMCIVYE